MREDVCAGAVGVASWDTELSIRAAFAVDVEHFTLLSVKFTLSIYNTLILFPCAGGVRTDVHWALWLSYIGKCVLCFIVVCKESLLDAVWDSSLPQRIGSFRYVKVKNLKIPVCCQCIITVAYKASEAKAGVGVTMNVVVKHSSHFRDVVLRLRISGEKRTVGLSLGVEATGTFSSNSGSI